MSLPALNSLLKLVERGYVPDPLIRFGIRRLVAAGMRDRETQPRDAAHDTERDLVRALRDDQIAVDTDAANEQHYELPPRFFELCLGKHRKYSGCYWPAGVTNLDDAEAASLRETCAHADLLDGQRILELGCGWGSLSLWMAEHYPHARITAVSNSAPQRAYIMRVAQERGLNNLAVITADMNDFTTDDRFDRVVSVEMFEHMRNYERLMARIASWLKPDGKLFVHIFAHRHGSYLFETSGAANWMGRYFFTGGIMPGDDLLLRFQRDVVLEDQWRQNGTHYAHTANAWLRNMDNHRAEIMDLFREVYGVENATIWWNRWRVFYLACAEMFGYDHGNQWWVSHYRFAKRNVAQAGNDLPHIRLATAGA